MFEQLFKVKPKTAFSSRPIVMIEGLEDRRLLSASAHASAGHHHGRSSHSSASIEFSQAPAAVQTGLDALATADSLTAPTTTQKVFLANTNGVETYTVDITGTGSDTKLTVDVNGNAVTAATTSSTTFSAVTNTAVTNEISAIATALNLTAPDSTTAVSVATASDGTATYSISLTNSTSTSSGDSHDTRITVDSNGNPVGHESVPLSTLSSVIQTGLTANAPTGATALDATTLIRVQTSNGVTTYTATYTSTGTTTTVSVNSAGVLTSLPSSSQVAFSTLPTAAQTELQALATADGVTTTIADTQTVTAYDEANGTIVYSVRLAAAGTSSDSSTTDTYNITLSVDENGNPTVPPEGNFGGGGFGGGGGCDFGGSIPSGSTASSSDSGESASIATLSRSSRRR